MSASVLGTTTSPPTTPASVSRMTRSRSNLRQEGSGAVDFTVRLTGGGATGGTSSAGGGGGGVHSPFTRSDSSRLQSLLPARLCWRDFGGRRRAAGGGGGGGGGVASTEGGRRLPTATAVVLAVNVVDDKRMLSRSLSKRSEGVVKRSEGVVSRSSKSYSLFFRLDEVD